jgi:hypothetical protein
MCFQISLYYYVTYLHMYIRIIILTFVFTLTGTYDVKEHVYGIEEQLLVRCQYILGLGDR